MAKDNIGPDKTEDGRDVEIVFGDQKASSAKNAGLGYFPWFVYLPLKHLVSIRATTMEMKNLLAQGLVLSRSSTLM